MEDQIYITIAKSLNGEATAADEQELKAWLMADPGNAAIYDEMAALWKDTDKVFETPAFNSAAAWDKISPRIQPEAVKVTPKTKRLVLALPTWIKYSAGLAAILLIAFFIGRPLLGTGTITIAANDNNQVVELPDHSKITLRKGSSLRYPRRFAAAQRNVSLEGEAFFEVARNEQQPFVIDAQSANVRVLGTSFNVICSPTAASVTVATGKVQMSRRNSNEGALILTHGKQGILKEGRLSADSVNNTNYLFWKTGELSYSNTPLNQVVNELSALKDTVIKLDMAADVQQQPVTISFKNQSLEDMLSDLCLIARCELVKHGDAFLIRAK